MSKNLQIEGRDVDLRTLSQSCLSTNKRVRFHGKVKVVLIPSLSEYIEADLHELLWWKIEDFRRSMEDSICTSSVEQKVGQDMQFKE